MKNIWRTAASVFLLAAALVGCAVSETHAPQRIALVAPFEGRYREIGYNALYAVRLQLAESGLSDRIELLAVDDGGDATSAALKADALARDSQVIAAIVLGPYAAQAGVQPAYGDLPVIVAGNWTEAPENGHIFLWSPPNTTDGTLSEPDIITLANQEAPLTGGEILALAQLPQLRPDLNGITINSLALLPDADFRERYMGTGLFVPEPTLIATVTYDATGFLLDHITAGISRNALAARLMSGFSDGYRTGAPVFTYRYTNSGVLVPVDGVVE